jgi:aminopeptidase N
MTLTVKQTQKVDLLNEYPQTQYFQSRVEIEIDGRVEQVWLEPKAENVFTFDAAAQPKIVNFDYEGTLLKELKFDKSVDDLIYQMLNDRDILGRRWAMDELEGKARNSPDKDRITAALIEAFGKEKSSDLRRAAFARIRNLSLPTTQGAPIVLSAAVAPLVLKAAKDENSLIRADAIDLLGATRDAKYVDLFIAALNDRSYTVIDSAAGALGSSKDARGFDGLIRLAKTDSWHGRVATAGFSGLAMLGDKRAFDESYKFVTNKNNDYNARQAALTVVAATGKGDERAFPVIFEKFKSALDANDLNSLSYAVQSIIKIADPRGQQAFDMLRAKFKDQPNLMNYVNAFEAQFKAAIGK